MKRQLPAFYDIDKMLQMCFTEVSAKLKLYGLIGTVSCCG